MGVRTRVCWLAVLLAAGAAPVKLDDGVTVVAHAATLDALVATADPKLVWGERNFAWVTHGPATKKVGFRLNRATRAKVDGADVWCLLVGDGCYDGKDEAVRYAQADDADPIVVARDPVRGVVYQARWTDQSSAGTGRYTDQRTVLFLCDGRHRWSVLGEGPRVLVHGRCGWSSTATGHVETHVEWTADPKRPVRLAFTVCQTQWMSRDGHGWADGADHRERTERWTAVPGRPLNNGRLIAGPMMDDEPPGPWVRTGPRYALADRAEPVGEWAARWEVDDEAKPAAPAAVAALAAAVRRANPRLGERVEVGQRIELPPSPDTFHPTAGPATNPGPLTPTPVPARR